MAAMAHVKMIGVPFPTAILLLELRKAIEGRYCPLKAVPGKKEACGVTSRAGALNTALVSVIGFGCRRAGAGRRKEGEIIRI
jgi:hypothetical protein